MRRICLNAARVLICALLIMTYQAVAQTATTNVADDGEPYGGVNILHLAVTPGTLPPANSGGACPAGPPVSPCVLTGQYSRYRTSVNPNESTLANIPSTSASSFGLTSFYQLPSHTLPTDPNTGSQYTYEPVVAQPLYITDVPISGVNKNILLVASLAGYVYGFDTSSGSQVWTAINLPFADCPPSGAPFNDKYSYNPGAVNLQYYGAVATPVIDVYSAVTTVPVAFVTSACVYSSGPKTIQWNLDAINLETGAEIGHAVIDPTGLNPSYQLSRPSLLLTHPTSSSTDVYVAFGGGAGELKADAPCPSGFSTCAYSGWMILYSVTYNSSSSVTFSQAGAFSNSGQTNTSVFPSVYTGLNSSDPPLGPSGTASGSNDSGDNWAVSQGGIWMSSGGPSSTASAKVYAASGNGPLACTPSTATQCTNLGNMVYWGESAIQFPAANASNPATPTDFFSPYVQRYTNNSYGDSMPASTQTQELSRLDLDFGATAVVLISPEAGAAPYFAITADKSGYMYVTPAEPNGTGVPVMMGEFQQNDAGLTTLTSTNALTTEVSFQASQLPQAPNRGNPVCPLNDVTNWTNTGNCDEIHEIAALGRLAYVWPMNEGLEAFQGTLTETGSGSTATYNYTYVQPGQTVPTPVFNPCPLPLGSDPPAGCTGTYPNFPNVGTALGGTMAIAYTDVTSPTASLWAIVPEPNEARWGLLYGYSLNTTTGGLTYWWDSHGSSMTNCTGHPTVGGWLATSFTEPTVANGVAYVPAACVVTSGGPYTGCEKVPSTNIASGVLAFSACPE